jgi:hypothetical protein
LDYESPPPLEPVDYMYTRLMNEVIFLFVSHRERERERESERESERE